MNDNELRSAIDRYNTHHPRLNNTLRGIVVPVTLHYTISPVDIQRDLVQNYNSVLGSTITGTVRFDR